MKLDCRFELVRVIVAGVLLVLAWASR